MLDRENSLPNPDPDKFRRCVIHIGTEKTGTTSIQKFLSSSRKSLQAEGVIYPASAGLHGGSQWEFVACAHSKPWMMDLGKRFEIKSADDQADFKNKFHEQLENEFRSVTRKDLLIISSEHFHSRLQSNDEIEEHKVFLEPWCSEIRILAYLRRQDRVAVSYYSTKLKGGDPNPVLFPKTAPGKLPYYFDYLELYNRWSAVFGQEKIDIRLFESTELIGGDLLHDFCSSVGIEPRGASRVPRLNQSLNREGLELALALNRQATNTAEENALKLHAELIDFIAREYSGYGAVASRREAVEFLEKFAVGNELVRSLAMPHRAEPLFDSDFSSYPEELEQVEPKNLSALMEAIKSWQRPRADFDEIGYRKAYPDVDRAIAAGRLSSAWQHYQLHGRQEGRRPNEFADLQPLKMAETVDDAPVHLTDGAGKLDSETFLFCTSYIGNNKSLKNRYKKWYKHYRRMTSYPIFIIDDKSPFSLENAAWMNFDASKVDHSLANFHTFNTHLGRINIHNFPGWFRSFVHSVEIARKFNFKRIIHVESDLIILKSKMFEELCEINSGWNVIWSAKYNMPETAVQVICEDQFDSVLDIYEDYKKMNKDAQAIETILPFTNIIKTYTGDRYGGDNIAVEDYMDYYAQFPVNMEIEKNLSD